MKENINLCKILKDCPRGTRFWSPMLGNLEFLCIIEPKILVNTIEGSWEINSDSTITIDCFTSAEPMLFPSKDQRDWSKWKYPKPKFDPKTLNPFDKVLAKIDLDNAYLWMPNIFSSYNNNWYYTIGGGCYRYILPYNDETKYLSCTTYEAPEFYRYWED